MCDFEDRMQKRTFFLDEDQDGSTCCQEDSVDSMRRLRPSGISIESQGLSESENQSVAESSTSPERSSPVLRRRSEVCRSNTKESLMSMDFWSEDDCTESRHRSMSISLGSPSSMGSPNASSRADGKATIIFDWDDTLFPTWYVEEVVLPCNPGDTLTEGGRLPEDSSFAKELRVHAVVVEAVLREARRHGNVAIVTLGAKPWVQTSAERWLPTLCFPSLKKELGIKVVYARDCIKRHNRGDGLQEGGGSICTFAKALAMQKVVQAELRRGVFSGNLLSIGDSSFERDAAKEFLWRFSETPRHRHLDPVCKTVKLLDDPNLEELQMQLGFVSDWLPHMVSQPDDFDLCLMEAEDASILRLAPD